MKKIFLDRTHQVPMWKKFVQDFGKNSFSIDFTKCRCEKVWPMQCEKKKL